MTPKRNGARSFVVMHTLNSVAALGFTLLQTIVLARTLETRDYAMTILVVSLSFYYAVLNQATARSLFIGLTRDGETPAFSRKALRQLVLGLAAIAVASLALFAVLFPADPVLLGFAFYVLSSNYWTQEIQFVCLGLGLRAQYERDALLRRAILIGALGLLWLTRSFALFVAVCVVLNVVSIALYLARLRRSVSREGDASRMPRREARKQFAVSVLGGSTEMALLNVPYLVISLLGGLGAALITFDTVMKLMRAVVGAARNLSEIALVRQTRFNRAGDRRGALRLFLMTASLSFAGSAVCAAIVLVAYRPVMDLLLGPMSRMVPDAAWSAALIIAAAGIFQPSMSVVQFNPVSRQSVALLATGLAVAAGYAAVVWPRPTDAVYIVECFAIAFAGFTVLAFAAATTIVGRRREAPGETLGEP